MIKIVQAVPNFSEGRDIEKINRIVDSVRNIDGVKLVDYSSDKSHNRTVVTLLGDISQILIALEILAENIFKEIDMRLHKGAHPRSGALDVCPIIPIKNIDMEEVCKYAEKLGQTIGNMGVPVYMYEYNASSENRKNLATIRRGEYEGFFDKINIPEWKPDFGPNIMNEKTGVCVVGARDVLIAFNVNLNTNKIEIARAVSDKIRNIGGGLRFVKALPIYLEEKDLVQVSMNLVNYKKSSIYSVVELIKIEARRYGVSVLETELIGAMPMDALIQTAKYYLQINGLKQSQILENSLLEDLWK